MGYRQPLFWAAAWICARWRHRRNPPKARIRRGFGIVWFGLGRAFRPHQIFSKNNRQNKRLQIHL
jgi:hypothetical protein